MKKFSEEDLHGRVGTCRKCEENCVFEQIYETDHDVLGSNSHYETICTKDGYDKKVLSSVCSQCEDKILIKTAQMQ